MNRFQKPKLLNFKNIFVVSLDETLPDFSNTVTLRRIASLIKLILMGSSGFLCCMKCGTRHSGKCNIRKSSRRISDLE